MNRYETFRDVIMCALVLAFVVIITTKPLFWQRLIATPCVDVISVEE